MSSKMDPAYKEHPLLNSLILNNIFDEIDNPDELKIFRLVCKAWNHEASRCLWFEDWGHSSESFSKEISNRDELREKTRLLKYASNSYLPQISHLHLGEDVFRSYLTEILEFLRLAGSNFYQLTLVINAAPCGDVILLEVLRKCQVVNLTLFWNAAIDYRMLKRPGEKITFPCVNGLKFHSQTEITYNYFLNDLLEALPNIEILEFTPTYRNHLTEWFLTEALHSEAKIPPGLLILPPWNQYWRPEFTDCDLQVITKRAFPLVKLEIDCTGTFIQTSTFNNLIQQLKPTLLDFTVHFSPDQQSDNLSNLSDCLKHLENLLALRLVGTNVKFGTIWNHMKKLQSLSLYNFCYHSFVSDTLTAAVQGYGNLQNRELKRLRLAGISEPKFSLSLLQFLWGRYPNICALQLCDKISGDPDTHDFILDNDIHYDWLNWSAYTDSGAVFDDL